MIPVGRNFFNFILETIRLGHSISCMYWYISTILSHSLLPSSCYRWFKKVGKKCSEPDHIGFSMAKVQLLWLRLGRTRG